MKPRSVKPIALTKLERLPTHRILSYLKKLQHCEESIKLSDWPEEEALKVDGIVFKSSRDWVLQYKQVKSVLSKRPHVQNNKIFL